ncbi:hypothetical protein [Gordonia sp. (in: high G+C Gram-positive bacteria)]|uniref:hypothetical protein n=1 Tax=Gordonia sp. (in: high G+C Gram-positive bacteria) TaxID=84139 RepID=UPI003C764910
MAAQRIQQVIVVVCAAIGVLVLALAGSAWVGTGSACACSCRPMPADELVATVDAIVAGTPVSVEEHQDRLVYVFDVGRSYKLPMAQQIRISTPRGGGSCEASFAIGEPALVPVNSDISAADGDLWRTHLCLQSSMRDPAEVLQLAGPALSPVSVASTKEGNDSANDVGRAYVLTPWGMITLGAASVVVLVGAGLLLRRFRRTGS